MKKVKIVDAFEIVGKRTQVLAFYSATLSFNIDCAKRGLGRLKPSVLTTLRHKVSFFSAYKTHHCLRWDKNSRIVKDYARLLLHCISWYRDPVVCMCWVLVRPYGAAWWVNRGSVLSRMGCVINTPGTALYDFFLFFYPPHLHGVQNMWVCVWQGWIPVVSFCFLVLQVTIDLLSCSREGKRRVNKVSLNKLFMEWSPENVSIIERSLEEFWL